MCRQVWKPLPRAKGAGLAPTLLVTGFPGGSVVKKLLAGTGDAGLIPGLGRSPGEGNGNPLQYSCLGNPMDRGAWQAIVHRVAQSWTRLKQLSMHAYDVFIDTKEFCDQILRTGVK